MTGDRGEVGVPCHAATREVVALALRSDLEIVSNIHGQRLLHIYGQSQRLLGHIFRSHLTGNLLKVRDGVRDLIILALGLPVA